MVFDWKQDQRLTEVSALRSLWDIFLCYAGIGLSFVLFRISPAFLPFCLILSANRLFALSLVSHEAVHCNISRNKKINDLIGRYLCAFPCFISLSKYRRLHLFHHRAVGTPGWDPDHAIYSPFPVKPWPYALAQLLDLITLRTARKHIDYYTEWPELKRKAFPKDSDGIAYLAFMAAFSLVLALSGGLSTYLLIVTVPYLVIVQPFVLIVGGLQHGSVNPLPEPVHLRSRTILDHPLLVRLLLPLDINYHAEHHLAPQVPHYRLKDLSRSLRGQDPLWRQSFRESFGELFRT